MVSNAFATSPPPFDTKMKNSSNFLSNPSNTLVSSNMNGMNAEVVEATNPINGTIYEAWIANFSIGFAYSNNGGASFSGQKLLPGSLYAPGSYPYSWDPAMALMPNGSIVIAFMHEFLNQSISPVVDFSFDGGYSFPVSSIVHSVNNSSFSDRDFVAVALNGTVYLTWNFAPNASMVGLVCPPSASCYYSAGDFNGMITYSSDLGKSWSTPSVFSPDYPYGGMVAAPIVISSDGTIMILYEDYNMTPDHTLENGYNYFIKSTDGGTTWTQRVIVGAGSGYLQNTDWWIDGDLTLGSNGILYATFDSYVNGVDLPYLSYSLNGGTYWSTFQVDTSSTADAHLIQLAAGANGTVFVAWVTNSGLPGWAAFVRVFSTVTNEFISPVEKLSENYGANLVWGGDTIGVAALKGNTVGVSWGQAKPTGGYSEIYFSSMTFYNVSIEENGLPSGSQWSVALSGITDLSNSSSISFALPNGTYDYSVLPIFGYQVSSPSGPIAVNGYNAVQSITFTMETLYDVTFVESGLPSGMSWAVTLNTTAYSSTNTSTASTITFSVPNGTYNFTVSSITNYTTSPSSGIPHSIWVNGSTVNQTITFSHSNQKTTSPFNPVYIAIIGGIVAVAVIGTIMMIRRKK